MRRNNVIFSEKALEKHKRIENKKTKIDGVLNVIKDKKQYEENERIRHITYMQNRGRFAVLDDSSDDDNYDIIPLKKYISSPRIVPVKTCNKVSFIDKKVHDILQKKRDHDNEIMQTTYGYWPLPTMKQLMYGKRSFMDYPENALLFELTNMAAGWSIYMEFMEGKLNGSRLGVITNAINNARRKRRWLWSPEEHARIEREETEEEEKQLREETAAAEKQLREETAAAEKQLREETAAAEKQLKEETAATEKKLKEEMDRMCGIEEQRIDTEIKQKQLHEKLYKDIQECIYFKSFTEYLHIPGGWGYIVDVFDSNYKHPIQKSISYFNDTYADSESESDSEEDADTDIEDFSDCISDIE